MSKPRPKWQRISAASEILTLAGVKLGEVARDFRGDWIAIQGTRPVQRCRDRVTARRVVKSLVPRDGERT